MNDSQSETKLSIEDKGQVERCLKFEIPREVFDKRYNSMLARTASQAHLKGFRPGRAPRAIVAKMYGAEIQGKAFDELVTPALTNAITENKWRVVGTPTLDDLSLKDGMPVEATIRLYLYPEPTIQKWEGIEVDVEVEEYRPEEVEHQLLHIRERAGTFVDVTDRQQVQVNDYAVINFTMSHGGEIKHQSEDGDPWMIHVSHTPTSEDDLSPYVIGRTVGEKVAFTHKFSAGYDREPGLADQEVNYDIEILGIKLRQIPELNDELCEKVGFQGTLDELRADIAIREQERVADANISARESAVFSKLVELNPVEIPEPMIEYQAQHILEEMGVLGPDKKVSEEEREKYFGYVRGGAIFRASRIVLMKKIIEINEWDLSEEEFTNWIRGKAAEAGISEEIFRAYMKKQIAEGSLKNAAMSDIALERIMEKAIINEKVLEREACSTHAM